MRLLPARTRSIASPGFEGVKKSNSSRQGAKAQRRKGAKEGKEEQLCFLCAFKTFAPLREMPFLFGRFFHIFKWSGSMRLRFENTNHLTFHPYLV
jgi:hypothetical protein